MIKSINIFGDDHESLFSMSNFNEVLATFVILKETKMLKRSKLICGTLITIYLISFIMAVYSVSTHTVLLR